jgi:hypothetical protein
MATFGINPGMGQGEIVGAINYLLANIGQGIQVNAGNGIVTIPNNNTPFSYAYPYMYIAFANSFDGTVGFDQHDYTNKLYYGLWNTATLTPGGSSNPAQYVWYKVADGGFGTTNNLYYSVPSSLQVQFVIDTVSPNSGDLVNEYLWRGYDAGLYSGINIGLITNATNLDTNLAATGDIYTQTSSGGVWSSPSSITVGSADTLKVIDGAPYDINYYLPLMDSTGTYATAYSDVQLKYISSLTSTNNVLTMPNARIDHVLNLTPLSAAPAVYNTGSIAVANRTGWDPAGVGSGPAYVAFYNGSAWVKLG